MFLRYDAGGSPTFCLNTRENSDTSENPVFSEISDTVISVVQRSSIAFAMRIYRRYSTGVIPSIALNFRVM